MMNGTRSPRGSVVDQHAFMHGSRKPSRLSVSKEIPHDAADNKPAVKEEEEVVERILKASDPNVTSTPVYFDYRKEARAFKFVPHVGHTATHFATPGVAILKTSPEAIQQEEDRARRQKEVEAAAEAELNPDLVDDGVSTKILKNQFNYSDRGSQTMNHALKERAVRTDPPPSGNFGAMATAWSIYDAYEADRQQLERQAAAQKKAAVMHRAGKDEERSAAPTAGSVLGSAALGHAAKLMERMVNQNDCFEIIDDFRYWEDQSDLYKDDGTLLPLWQFFNEKTKRRTVTSLALNARYHDFFAVGYGSYDFQKPCKGVIHCFTLKNAVPTVPGVALPAHPEFSFFLESGVMCIAFHPLKPALLACGLHDGSVCVFDLRIKNPRQRVRPLYQATVRNGKHTDPVWSLFWKTSGPEDSFYSLSTDGRMTNWMLSKKEITSKDVVTLSTGVCTADPEALILNQLSGTCMHYSQHHDKVIVGTLEGKVLLCTTSYNGQCMGRYEGHAMAVYAAYWNPFHPDVFITCSADWSVKLWLVSSPKPLLEFDLGDAVGDVVWAPYSSTVFAAVTSNGKVCVFDLEKSKVEPLCVQTVVKNAQLTHILFSEHDPVVFVGDSRGSVLTLKLSPNLRRVTSPPKGKDEAHVTPHALEVDKLSYLIEIILKDRALLS